MERGSPDQRAKHLRFEPAGERFRPMPMDVMAIEELLIRQPAPAIDDRNAAVVADRLHPFVEASLRLRRVPRAELRTLRSQEQHYLGAVAPCEVEQLTNGPVIAGMNGEVASVAPY